MEKKKEEKRKDKKKKKKEISYRDNRMKNLRRKLFFRKQLALATNIEVVDFAFTIAYYSFWQWFGISISEALYTR